MKEYKIIFEILKEYYENKSFLKNLIDIRLKKEKSVNSSFVTDFVYGIIRHDIYLEHIIKKLTRKVKKKDFIYLKILFYGIIFRENSKNELFINDFINFIKKPYKKKSGFFNALARNYLRNGEEFQTKDKRIIYSVPTELFNYIENNIEDEELKEKIYRKMTQVPKFYFRTNTQDRELLKKIAPNHILKNIYRFDKNLNFSSLKKELKEGKIFIQDISSQIIPHILAPDKTDYIADFCSAPGGKSLLLSQLSDNKAKILSIELSQERYKKLTENIKKHSNIKAVLQDASNPVILNGKKQLFDKILVDAPCSALGTVSKSPDKKYRFKEINLSEYSEIQLKILNNALAHLKKGGILLYSLCTFTKEETVETVNKFLETNKNKVKLVNFETPDKKFKGNMLYTAYLYDGDIFFIAKFVKL